MVADGLKRIGEYLFSLHMAHFLNLTDLVMQSSAINYLIHGCEENLGYLLTLVFEARIIVSVSSFKTNKKAVVL